jgi:hypothetical protein
VTDVILGGKYEKWTEKREEKVKEKERRETLK